jgi:hypothetical protein
VISRPTVGHHFFPSNFGDFEMTESTTLPARPKSSTRKPASDKAPPAAEPAAWSAEAEAELLALAENFFEIHDTWAGDTANNDPPKEDYYFALAALVFWLKSIPVPMALMPLAKIIQELGRVLCGFADRGHVNWDELDPAAVVYREHAVGEMTLYSVQAKLREAIKNLGEQLSKLPTVKELAEAVGPAGTKTSHAQIARMYGLIDRYGKPQAHLIQKELDDPGSVIGPDWVDPHVKERDDGLREAARQWNTNTVADISCLCNKLSAYGLCPTSSEN